MSRVGQGVLLAFVLLGGLVFWMSSFQDVGPVSLFKELLAADHNAESLWKHSVFESLQSVDHSDSKGEASPEGLAVTKHASQEWIQRKFQYLYSVQGARLQQGFKQRPKEHKLIDGVWDPISFEDSERQKKKYQEMVDILRKNREKTKQRKLDEKKKKKLQQEESRRKKESKDKEEAQQKGKEETQNKAVLAAEKLQAEADQEGLSNDPKFLQDDMEKHLKVKQEFPKFQLQEEQSVVIVTLAGELSDSDSSIAIIKNRKAYCELHGYKCVFPEYSQIPAASRWKAAFYSLRQYFQNRVGPFDNKSIRPGDWVWYLSSDVLITNMNQSVADILLQPDSLKSHLAYGSRFQDGRGHFHPTIRFPEKINDASRYELILSRRQSAGFMTKSFLIRNTESMLFWLNMLLDDDSLAEHKVSKEAGEGNILQYLYLTHVLLRDYIAVVTPRLLVSRVDDSSEHRKWQQGDLAALKSTNVEGWKKLISQVEG